MSFEAFSLQYWHPVMVAEDQIAGWILMAIVFSIPKALVLVCILVLIWLILKHWTGGTIGCLLILVVITFSFLLIRIISGV